MAIKYGKGLRGALGKMQDIEQQYVGLPYKEMLTGNLMRQAAYDKSQESIDSIDNLYDAQVLSQDKAILNSQEESFDSELQEQMESVGGDLGKLTGFLSSKLRTTTKNPTYRNALQSKAQYDKYYEDVMNSNLDPQVKQYKIRQSQANYMGADKGVFQGASYVDMNQIDFDKRMRKIAKEVPKTKTTRQVPIVINKNTGIKYTEYDDAGYYTLKEDGTKEYASSQNAVTDTQEITTERKDPREIAILLNNAIQRSGVDSAYIRQLLEAQNPGQEITPQDVQDFIYSEELDENGNVSQLTGLASQYANESRVDNYDEGTYSLPEEEEIEGPEFTSAKDMFGNFIGETPMQTIEGSTSAELGAEVIDLDDKIRETQDLIDANPNAVDAETNTNTLRLSELKTERNALLKRAVESSERQIKSYAGKSVFWDDDGFDNKMKSQYKNAAKNKTTNPKTNKSITQEEFTKKAKLLAAIPGIESISPLLSGGAGDIEQLFSINSANYELLKEEFEDGESVMPYLVGAQWIANRARRADVVSTYETSLRTVKGGDSNDYVSRMSEGLEDMVHARTLAVTDFYSDEDALAEELEDGIERELIEVLPTLTMIDGSPAYQLNIFEPTESGVNAEKKKGKLKSSKFVKGTNSSDEMVRYETLGVNMLKKGFEQLDTPTGQQYYNEGVKIIANSRVLAPLQRTQLETLPMTGNNKDADGNPYIEKRVDGFNMVLRRVDKANGISMYELRSLPTTANNFESQLIGYNDPATQSRQPIVGASLQDITLKYFTQSSEPINASGATGMNIINSYTGQ